MIPVALTFLQARSSFAEPRTVARGYNPCFPRAPQIFRGAIPDSRKQFHHAIKGDFIAWIGHETDERRYVFNVRLFEKANATGDLVRDARRESSNCSSSA